jgi:hypothetical protein
LRIFPSAGCGARGRSWRSQTRSIDIGRLQETFLVSGVTTILVVRSELWLTNYPQLGGGQLHIAHLLWGGVFMLIAIGMLLSFVGRSLRRPSAVIGGIGFGLFLDEVGKFVTADNDYFFKPTAAIIYVVFVALFLISRAMHHRRGFSPREYLVNAIDLLAEGARRDLDERERQRAVEWLGRADPRDPLVGPVRKLLEDREGVAPRHGFAARFAERVQGRLRALVERPSFTRGIGWLFTAWALISLVSITLIALSVGLKLGGVSGVRLSGVDNHFSALNIASLGSSTIAGALVAYGVWRLHRGSRLDAYRLFDRAVLVQIFFGRFFSFVESQFGAVFGLAVDILLLVTVRYLLQLEQQRLGKSPPPVGAAPLGGGPELTSS